MGRGRIEGPLSAHAIGVREGPGRSRRAAPLVKIGRSPHHPLGAMAQDGAGAGSMRWDDRVYGAVAIDDPGILTLIGCRTFQRLKGVNQAGPSAFAYPFKTVTRYEHSLGVYL